MKRILSSTVTQSPKEDKKRNANERHSRWILFLVLMGAIGAVGAAEPSTASQALTSVWDAVKEFGELALKAVYHMFLWGFLGLGLGAVAGVCLWRALRDRGWMDLPWGWYKYVRWLWPVLMVGTLSLGIGSALGVWAGGRTIKQGAREKVFETAVVNTYSAIMEWRGKGSAEDTNGTSLGEHELGQAQAYERAVRKRVMEAVDQQAGDSRLQKWFGREVVEFVWDEQLKGKLTDTDQKKFLASLLADDKTDAKAVELAKEKIKEKVMSGIHLAFDETVNSIVYPTLVTILFTGLTLLLGPLGLFWLIRWLCLRRRNDTESSPGADDDPPLLNADSN
jgi:hypothetical protein